MWTGTDRNTAQSQVSCRYVSQQSANCAMQRTRQACVPHPHTHKSTRATIVYKNMNKGYNCIHTHQTAKYTAYSIQACTCLMYVVHDLSMHTHHAFTFRHAIPFPGPECTHIKHLCIHTAFNAYGHTHQPAAHLHSFNAHIQQVQGAQRPTTRIHHAHTSNIYVYTRLSNSYVFTQCQGTHPTGAMCTKPHNTTTSCTHIKKACACLSQQVPCAYSLTTGIHHAHTSKTHVRVSLNANTPSIPIQTFVGT